MEFWDILYCGIIGCCMIPGEAAYNEIYMKSVRLEAASQSLEQEATSA